MLFQGFRLGGHLGFALLEPRRALDQVHLRLFGETLPMATERYGVIRIIPEFLIGVGLYRLGQAYALPRPAARYAFIAVLAVYLWAAHAAWDDRAIALLGAPIIFLLAELDRHAGETRAGAMSYLGDISYSVYMIHVPFFMVSFNLLQDVLGVVDQTISWPILLVMMVVMIGVSAGTYEWVERPARTRLREWGEAWLSRRRRT